VDCYGDSGLFGGSQGLLLWKAIKCGDRAEIARAYHRYEAHRIAFVIAYD